MHQVVLDGISDNMASLVQSGKYVSINTTDTATNIFLFFWDSLRGSIACSLLVGGITDHNSVYKVNRLCPSIVLSYYLVLPTLIPVPSSLPVPIPSPRFSPPLRPNIPPLSILPPPSKIRPATTTSETPMSLASEQTAHRGT